MILFEFQFNLKLYFLTGHQLCARDLLSSGNTAPSHFYYDTYSDLEFYFDMSIIIAVNCDLWSWSSC